MKLKIWTGLLSPQLNLVDNPTSYCHTKYFLMWIYFKKITRQLKNTFMSTKFSWRNLYEDFLMTQISYLFITFPSKKHIILKGIHHQCFNQQTFLSFVRLEKEPTSLTIVFCNTSLDGHDKKWKMLESKKKMNW